MGTKSIRYFIEHFMDISKKFTSAEMRMLYLLITEPDVIDLSQQEFANRITAHRRTINIGLKKLREYKIISDIQIQDKKKNISDYQNKYGIKNISKREEIQAKKFIIDSFKDFYYPLKEEFIVVNEDFYSFILGDLRLHENFRYNKEFITKTINESYPKCKFHFKQDKSSYVSEIHFNIIHVVNNEFSKARSVNRNSINKAKLLKYMYDNYSIDEEVVLKVVKEYFHKVIVVKNSIRIHKPWKGHANIRG